jgi:hypothetical protein
MAATTAGTRKPPAKKKAAAAPRRTATAAVPSASVPEDVEARASVVLDPDREVAPPDMVPIFAIGDTRYYAPINPRASVELKFLWMVRHEGEAQANAFLLEELVGPDGFMALMNYDALTPGDLERIFAALREAVEGAATRGPKGGLRTI